MSIKVSIIIPFFNGEKYLEECVNSITAQTLEELEVILVDDGSTDNSAAVAEKLISKDSRIKLIRQENKGVSTARNVAMKEALGEYFMFVDADDRLKVDACEVLYNAITETQSDIVSGTYDAFNEERFTYVPDNTGKKPKIYNREDIKKLSLNMGNNLFFQFVWRRLFSAKLIKENKIEYHPDIAIGEDTLFCLECFLSAEKTLTIPVTVYEYRNNTQGAMRSGKYNKKLTQSLILQYEGKKALCDKFLPEYKENFLKGTANFAYTTGCNLFFNNLFYKGNGNYKEYLKIVKSDMIQEMFRYFDINTRRSKSLDWIAINFISKKRYFLGYIMEKITFWEIKRRNSRRKQLTQK